MCYISISSPPVKIVSRLPDIHTFLLESRYALSLHVLVSYIFPLIHFPLLFYLILGKTGLFPTANATQPPIKQRPPIGVTGPRNLNLAGSSVNK
jgi:hypothetical protein